MTNHRAPAAAAWGRLFDDLQGLLTGTLFVGLGLLLFKQAGLLVGGTVGLALLAHYATGLDFSLAIMAVNLPFYVLAWLRMGWRFTLATLGSVALLAGLVALLPLGVAIERVTPLAAAVSGGLLCGAGMLILFRHQASLGGFNVLVLYLQERFGWRAGTLQMGIDAAIVLAALSVATPARVLWSVLGVVVLNLAIAVNHRPARPAPLVVTAGAPAPTSAIS